MLYLMGACGKYHPVSSTLYMLDPELQRPHQMLSAYVTQVYDVELPPPSIFKHQNMTPGFLCTAGQVQSFSKAVKAIFDTGSSVHLSDEI
jgi:hypothetical protein